MMQKMMPGGPHGGGMPDLSKMGGMGGLAQMAQKMMSGGGMPKMPPGMPKGMMKMGRR